MPQFTEDYVKDLKPTGKQYSKKDSVVRGLVLLVSPKGAKTFYVYRRIDGRPERVRLGPWPDLKVKRARIKAEKVNGQIAEGNNPADLSRSAREEMTVGELWDRYLRLHGKPHKKSWRNDELQYNKHLVQWKKRRLGDITRQCVARLHASIAATTKPRGGPIAANRVLALLSSMWGWGQEHLGLELPNPCLGVRRSKESARERTLSEGEIKEFLMALEKTEDVDIRDVLRVMLMTGQRKACVIQMTWAELNLRDHIWTIPAARMKSGRTHRVPLPPPIVQMLSRRNVHTTGGSERVFSLPTNDIRGGLKKVLDLAGLVDVTPHDLRRTCASWVGRHGKCDVAVLSALLGHSDKALGVLGVYRRPSIDEVQTALERTVRAMVATTADKGAVVEFAQ